jgi:hypothetical protein
LHEQLEIAVKRNEVAQGAQAVRRENAMQVHQLNEYEAKSTEGPRKGLSQVYSHTTMHLRQNAENLLD